MKLIGAEASSPLSSPAMRADPESRRRDALSWLLLALAVLAAAGWLLAPAVLAHLAYETPLLFERVPLPEPIPAGGRAFRAEVETAPWRTGHFQVLEDGEPLEWARHPSEVRRRGNGRYHVNPGAVLFAPRGITVDDRSSGSTTAFPAAIDGRRFELRRPRPIHESAVHALGAAFAVLHGILTLLLARGLRREAGGLGALAFGLLPVLAAVAALTITLGVCAALLPESRGDLLGEKLEQFEELHRAEAFDTVFLGSSRTYRHLDPATWTETFAAAGSSSRAFNLGVPEMRMPELLHLAEDLLASPGGGAIRRLVVEPEPKPLFGHEANRLTSRNIRWHDVGTLRRLWPGIQKESRNSAHATLLLFDRLEPAARRLLLIGRGLDLLEWAFGPPTRHIEPSRLGFLSLDQDRAAPRTADDRADLERRYAELHELPNPEAARRDWQRRMARLRRTPAGGRALDPYELELFAELQALADARGVELVFVLSPRPDRHPNLVHAAETGVVEHLIRFDDPDRHPAFYARSGRYDRHHLNDEQALRMTRMLARAVLSLDRHESRAP